MVVINIIKLDCFCEGGDFLFIVVVNIYFVSFGILCVQGFELFEVFGIE